jgi:transposase InsO family protein
VPWKETRAVDERVRFVQAVQGGEDDVSSLCRAHGISRKTGYKWLRRAAAGAALADEPRRPHCSPQTTSTRVQELLLELRRKRPTWGPRKLVAKLRMLHPGLALPAASTVGELLQRAGLVRKRRPSMKVEAYGASLTPMNEPNAVWCADFKGHFYTRDGRIVHPLTITDGSTRYIAGCRAQSRQDSETTQASFESAFRELGLPLVLRTDNGAPFASTAPGGLSRLGIWFLKLGIRLERIAPGKPTQNGRHERMHRTLAEETASPPARTFAQQQRRFDLFRRDFNEERPHQALDYRTPASIYVPSPRRFPRKLESPRYAADVETRRVRDGGEIKWRSQTVYVSQALAHEDIALVERDDDTWAVYFGALRLGSIDDFRFDSSLTDD